MDTQACPPVWPGAYGGLSLAASSEEWVEGWAWDKATTNRYKPLQLKVV